MATPIPNANSMLIQLNTIRSICEPSVSSSDRFGLNTPEKFNAHLAKVKALVESIFDPSTPSYALKLSQVGLTSDALYPLFKLLPTDSDDLLVSFSAELVSALTSVGYRTNILTAQEHALKGSTPNLRSGDDPHTPLGVLRNEMDLETARTARRLEVISGSLEVYYNQRAGAGLMVLLEDLNPETGRTLRDPRPIEFDSLQANWNQGYDISVSVSMLPYGRREKFPYRRG